VEARVRSSPPFLGSAGQMLASKETLLCALLSRFRPVGRRGYRPSPRRLLEASRKPAYAANNVQQNKDVGIEGVWLGVIN